MNALVSEVPTTIVTGALGVGKTSFIRDAFEHRPHGERWAVLVNEFGEVGLDGALLDGLTVKEIPGGCICCTAGVALRFGLVELLRTARPDRLFIEPTGLANPASLLDLLRLPGIRDAVAPRATITLVDPRHLSDPRLQGMDTFHAQTALADVLVQRFVDRNTPVETRRFEEFVGTLWPPPIHVGTGFDPAWLDLDPIPRKTQTHHDARAHTVGFVFPQTLVFDGHELETTLRSWLNGGPGIHAGAVRIKGLFRTTKGWLLAQGTSTTLNLSPALWRRDSRVDVISTEALDPGSLREQLGRALLPTA